MTFGYTRKKIGKMHKEFYAKRLAKARRSDLEAFQKTMVSTIKATLDVVDANNKKLTNDIMCFLHEHCKIEFNIDGNEAKIPNLSEVINEQEQEQEQTDERKDYNAYYGDEEDMREAMRENAMLEKGENERNKKKEKKDKKNK